jgi:hypothetical protein
MVVALLTCPAMGEKVKSFCEYGTGVSLRLGAGGALWDQTWGLGPWDWYECEAAPNVGILSGSAGGILETTTAGAPVIDPDLILSFTFGGELTLTAPGEGGGQIVGDVEGVFVADLNAARAIVDEDAGIITIAFGAAVEEGPDALITVTETTGKFKSIHAVGPWEWHVNGTINIAIVDGLDTQTNILAALINPDLLVGAEEEIVLSGSYYRSSPEK